MPALPDARTLITAVIDTLSQSTSSLPSRNPDRSKSDYIKNNNPLLNASPSTKSLILTLHALYPTDVLPALDLLDRRLILKLTLADDSAQQSNKVKNAKKSKEASGDNSSSIKHGSKRDENRDEDSGDRSSTRPDANEALKSSSSNDDADEDANADADGKSEVEKDGNSTTVFYVSSTAQTTQRRRAAPAGNDLSGEATTPTAALVTATATTLYEIRTQAWNCTCPAFTFAAFPMLKPIATDHAPTSDRSGGMSNRAQTAGEKRENEHDANHGDRSTTEEEAERCKATGANPKVEEEPSIEKPYESGWSFGGGSRRGGGTRAHAELPVCKHLLACVLAEQCGVFAGMVEERTVSRAEMAAWAAGWGI